MKKITCFLLCFVLLSSCYVSKPKKHPSKTNENTYGK